MMFVAPAVVIVFFLFFFKSLSHQFYKTADLHFQIRMAGIESRRLCSEHGGLYLPKLHTANVKTRNVV